VIILRRVDPDRPRPFRVPWVPLTPLISVCACLYLMYKLPGITWLRFAIWLAVGLVLYFLYGARHSRLRNAAGK
jgi:APA family basic amino acid/polyamine antiporter